MIKANEIRIGNWVSATENFEKFPAPMLVIGIGFASYDCMGNYELSDFGVTTKSDGGYNKSWPYEQLHPIPLTHDILLKCGFSNQELEMVDETITAFAYKDSAICTYWDGVEWCFKYGYDSDLTIAACEFVHQLQNLIFALTGEELEIKL